MKPDAGGEDRPAVPLVPGRIGRHTSCLVLKVGQVVFRLMEGQLASLGLRLRHYGVIETLDELGPMSQQDLGSYLRIDGATMVSTIDDLERLGLVLRARGDPDRRRYIVSVTAEGYKMLRRVEELMDELDADYLADITPAQRQQLHRTMSKLSAGDTLTRAFDEIRGR